MGLSWETRFGFGVCLDVRESLANAGMRHIFWIGQLSGKPGEKWKQSKVSWKGLEAQWRKKCLSFFLLARECSRGEERLHGVV